MDHEQEHRENLKNILTNVYGNKDNVDDTLVEVLSSDSL